MLINSDVSEPNPKKSSSKVEDDHPEDKAPKGIRRRKKKVIQAIIPLMIGMKSAAVVIFAMALVTALTLKAFVASKLALLVTLGLALKKLYESYSAGLGLQNHPYLYSQYPIDFPSASSHAYSVNGVSSQFASPEMFNPTALATNTHAHELLQQNDASAQQSQQAPTLQLINTTRASERWDGKSILLKIFEPIVDGMKSIVSPIANMFIDAMPATFRGLNSDVTSTKNYETSFEEEIVKPKEILLPQPRYIAQRKSALRKNMRLRPKKHTELKIDLNKLKKNKDLHDYVRIKKYQHNYPQSFFYPRIKYFINPALLNSKPNYQRLILYKKQFLNTTNAPKEYLLNFSNRSDDWKPIVVLNLNNTIDYNTFNTSVKGTPALKLSSQKTIEKRARIKRSTANFDSLEFKSRNTSIHDEFQVPTIARKSIYSKRGFFDFIGILFSPDPVAAIITQVNEYTKSVITESIKSKAPPQYYTIAYDVLMFGLEIIDGLLNMQEAVEDHISDKEKKINKKSKFHKQLKQKFDNS